MCATPSRRTRVRRHVLFFSVRPLHTGDAIEQTGEEYDASSQVHAAYLLRHMEKMPEPEKYAVRAMYKQEGYDLKPFEKAIVFSDEESDEQ